MKLSRPSDLKIWASKIDSLEANIKTLNRRNFFIFEDINVILTLPCSKLHVL